MELWWISVKSVGPVSQFHSPHLLVGARGVFSDFLRSVQMPKRQSGAESNGKLPLLYNPWWNYSLGYRVCDGRTVIAISGSLIWSKTLMELWWISVKSEDPVSQICSPHLFAGAPGMFSDLLRSVQMLKREWDAGSNRKLPYLFIISKIATLVPEFAVEDLPLIELQPWFLHLQQRTCPWTEHSHDDDECIGRNYTILKLCSIVDV